MEDGMEMGGSRKETENKNGVIARRGLSQALVWVDGWMDGWMMGFRCSLRCWDVATETGFSVLS